MQKTEESASSKQTIIEEEDEAPQIKPIAKKQNELA